MLRIVKMSCPCPICHSSSPRKTHSNSAHSPFTETSSHGCLQVTLNSSTVLPCKLRLKVNKMHVWIDFQGETVRKEVWTKTIEDELVVEVYHERLLLGETAIVLRNSRLNGSKVDLEIPSDFYETRIEVSLGLDYTPFQPGADVYHLYRLTCLGLEDAVLTLTGPQGPILTTGLTDKRARYRPNVWHYLETVPTHSVVNILLDCKRPGKKATQSFREILNLKDGNPTVPRFLDLGPDDSKLTLYISPGASVIHTTPTNTLRIGIPKTNPFLNDSELTSVTLSVKSPLVAEESDNEKILTQSDLQAAMENEDLDDFAIIDLGTFSAEDKIVVTIRGPQGTIKSIGLIKLVELPELQYQHWKKCLLQCGEDVLELRLMLQRDDILATRSKSASVMAQGSEGLVKPKVFYDILDMMDYKLLRIKQKNSLLNVQIGKLKKNREMQKKQLFELEHAPARAEFKSILQRGQKRPTESKPAKPEEELKICVCGAINPKFKGYCEKCVSKLKSDYEKLRKWFEPINKTFTDYERKLRSWTARKVALEYKLTRLEEKLQQPFVVEQTEESKQARELMEDFAKLQVDKELLEQESNVQFEKLDGDEEAALGVLAQTDEEIATTASEYEEIQHRNESLGKDIENTKEDVKQAQNFYEKHVRKLGKSST